jgi:hypothetical protein
MTNVAVPRASRLQERDLHSRLGARRRVGLQMVVEVKAEPVAPADPRWGPYYALASRRRRARGWHRIRDERPSRSPLGLQRKVLLLVCLVGLMGLAAAMLVP